MSRVVCVITEDDGITKHEYSPVGVKFKDEGSKKPNTLLAHFTINNKVRENYEIAYIQDIVSVEYLACIHNFQLSALDDRGYNLDGKVSGSVNIPESRFLDVTTGRFKGNYAIDFNAAGQQVDISNSEAISRVDLSGQFDIYLFFTPVFPQAIGGNDEPILWSFLDTIGGTQRGIEIGITNSVNDNEWRGFVRINNGITEVIRGTIELVNTDTPVLIRVFRDSDNVVKMEINGEPDGELLKVGSLQPTDSSTPIRFGSNKDLNQRYTGQIHQIRVYRGIVLTQTQADAIRQSRPALFTMKFAGRVWDLENKQSYKIAKCDSFSKDLVKRKLSADIFPAPNNDNRFGLQEEIDTLSFADVLTGGINFIDGQSVTLTGQTSGITTATAIVFSTAGVIDSIKMTSGSTGYINGETLTVVGGGASAGGTATATVTDETFQDILQDIVDATGAGFTVKAKDAFTSTTVSALQGYLIAVGSIIDVISFLLLFSSTTFYVTPRKLLIVETNAGHATDFTFDQDSSIAPYDITESDDNDTTKVNEATLTGNGIGPVYSKVATIGTDVTIRKYIRQLDVEFDLDLFVNLLVTLRAFVNTKFVVKINVLSNFVRFNHIVTINNTGKNIINDPFIVTQIEHEYPKSSTIIKVNENDIDFFDITNNDISIQAGLVDNTL